MKMGEKLRLIRTKAGIRQKDLANKLGITQSYLSNWENNNKLIPTKHIMTISKLFNIDMNYFKEDSTIEIVELPITNVLEELEAECQTFKDLLFEACHCIVDLAAGKISKEEALIKVSSYMSILKS